MANESRTDAERYMGNIPIFVHKPCNMRESRFIQQNKEKWQELEQASTTGTDSPERLSDLFVQVTDDLSYSRTFYPNRSVRVYLNALAQRIFAGIFTYKKNRREEFSHFWKTTLPALVRVSRREVWLACFIMAVSVAIGAFSQVKDPDFIRLVLGNQYLDMTRQNIANGDPMAVYKEAGAFSMFLGITLNNIWVSFLTFIMGIFFGIGTVAMLLRTGIMIGAFHAFFLSQGYLIESLLAVWLHGTLEISAFTLAGGAGLTMGRGWLFPGTWSRWQSFQLGARRGVSIMLGIVPVLVFAGFIEGFLTRYTDAPLVMRLGIICLSLAFILGYYVWYPHRLPLAVVQEAQQASTLSIDTGSAIQYDQIKSAGDLFSESFGIVRQYMSYYIGAALLGSLAFCAILGLTDLDHFDALVYPQWIFSTVIYLKQYFINQQIPLLPLLNIAIWGAIGLVVKRVFNRETGNSASRLLNFRLLKSMLPLAIFYVLLAFLPGVLCYIGLSIMVLPLLLWWFVLLEEPIGLFPSLRRTFFLLQFGWGNGLMTFFLLELIGMLTLSIADWAVGSIIVHSIGIGLGLGAQDGQLFSLLMTFLVYSLILLLVLLMYNATALFYYAQVEVNEAKGLRDRLEYVAAGKKIQGLDKE